MVERLDIHIRADTREKGRELAKGVVPTHQVTLIHRNLFSQSAHAYKVYQKNLCGTKMQICSTHAKQNCQKGMMQFSWQTKVREIESTTISPLLVQRRAVLSQRVVLTSIHTL